MIVLLNCSINLFANNDNKDLHSSTGELVQSNDSVLISYNDLRIVNSKLIELEYEKAINGTYRNIIKNDSIIIKDYTELNTRLNQDCKKAIKQRNIAIGSGVFVTILATILLLVK